MEITVADEQAWLLTEQLSMDQAEGRAWSKKTDAFGTMAKVTSFLQRPKDDEFELIYKEHRYQPFWHVTLQTRYVYERARPYTLSVSDAAVEKVTISGTTYVPQGGKVQLSGTEHCREEGSEAIFIEGIAGERNPNLATYLTFNRVEIPEDQLDEFAAKDVVVVPPKANASTIVQDVLAKAIKSIEADRIIENQITVETVDLYYHPVYAFQYRWLPKEKEAVLEYDGLTGELRTGGQVFKQHIGKMLDPQFLFDIGVDTVDLLVPGGGIAIKLAKRGISAAKSKKK
ncbi:MAG: hypothetical protein R3264_02900 [Anaerolineae bacterium]|nr:hypothetical protein [Anaerolineae bacterium]